MHFVVQISPTDIRGALGSVNQLSICVGILAALVAGLPLAGNPAWYFKKLNVFLLETPRASFEVLSYWIGACPHKHVHFGI